MLRWRAERALRLPGRARGVEDGGVVVGLELHVGQRAHRAASPRRSGGPITSSRRRTRGSAISSLVRARDVDASPGRGRRRGARAMRSQRSASTIATLAPESRRPYSSSGPVHHAFSGVTIAPASAAGPERDRPFGQVAHDDGDPVALLDAVRDQAAREPAHRRAMGVEGDALVLVDQVRRGAPCARPASKTSRSVGGAFFQTRMRTPRISPSSISKGCPGAVRRPCAWAMDMAGKPAGRY